MIKYDENNICENIVGFPWSKIKNGKYTYYFMDRPWKVMRFGKNNNYAKSYIRNGLINSNLSKKLKNKFGDRLVPISLDLFSLDGLDNYGIVEGDIIAIPTLDIYRKIRKEIPNLCALCWLSTPESTYSGFGSEISLFIGSTGDIRYDWCGSECGICPFFIIRS